jgi:hypothetical protein
LIYKKLNSFPRLKEGKNSNVLVLFRGGRRENQHEGNECEAEANLLVCKWKYCLHFSLLSFMPLKFRQEA